VSASQFNRHGRFGAAWTSKPHNRMNGTKRRFSVRAPETYARWPALFGVGAAEGT